jgi:hypothetical protein
MKRTPLRTRNPLRATGAATLLLLQACSGAEPVDEPGGAPSIAALKSAAASSGPIAETEGAAAGSSLAFQWSANGFEQLPERYQWTGSGKRDDVFQPYLSLSVPETDDAIWSSECTAEGKVKTLVYLSPPEKMTGNSAALRFETDRSAGTLLYDARYVATGQNDGFEMVLSPADPMFADMQAGAWAYLQVGEGANTRKLRISLVNVRTALSAFLPACTVR